MARVRITQSTVFDGSVWQDGAVVDVDGDLAARLIAAGIARPVGQEVETMTAPPQREDA